MAIDTRWLELVGELWMESASEPPSTRTLVASWDDAITIFDDSINGVLQAACGPIDKIYADHPKLDAWWTRRATTRRSTRR